MSGMVKRATRVAERLREDLSSLLRELSDPRLTGVLVSRVEITDDLQSARIYVRNELGVEDAASRRALLKGLEAASGRLRRDVARTMGLRVVPTLRFFYDEGIDAQRRVEDLLREIKDGSGGERS
ncbi:ribosome-binding factor A [Sorangium cellulosum]|uniref:Ribosome-binding factor A n=1 Tax=Sorangium cellulosum TaxID=56 RepID=A0A2L0F283_SORCE|nr:30S ribosome-binding factor RbfA [Sorangium cellulosum]AUX45611.1 ribosome-binding factor A [Sorangium cellulosum]